MRVRMLASCSAPRACPTISSTYSPRCTSTLHLCSSSWSLLSAAPSAPSLLWRPRPPTQVPPLTSASGTMRVTSRSRSKVKGFTRYRPHRRTRVVNGQDTSGLKGLPGHGHPATCTIRVRYTIHGVRFVACLTQPHRLYIMRYIWCRVNIILDA
ncbi:hypothetical protein C8Q77DRAFT_1211357 [Trametes polyzona]|nr:hypothetical protein C8Q77DRAFT_1211357 [Trametes polyzona]